eukprot:3143734-Rhodomonas_salina.1
MVKDWKKSRGAETLCRAMRLASASFIAGSNASGHNLSAISVQSQCNLSAISVQSQCNLGAIVKLLLRIAVRLVVVVLVASGGTRSRSSSTRS